MAALFLDYVFVAMSLYSSSYPTRNYSDMQFSAYYAVREIYLYTAIIYLPWYSLSFYHSVLVS